MQPSSPCPDCGAPIPADSPRGLCPRCCLLALGFGEPETSALPGIELGERLGGGAFGEVFEAIELDAGLRRVAVKLLRGDLACGEILARFEDEARLLALLDHPHVARLLRAGRGPDGTPYYVMELVHGEHLDRWAMGADPADRLGVLIQIAAALAAAHRAGIVHRDLKPSNILVESRPDGPHARVIDFGIARALEGPATLARELTLLGQRLGTPAYMSPEQLAGDPLIDTRSDLFALGLLIFEVELGRPELAPVVKPGDPWETQLQALRQHVFPPLPDRELGWIARKCCALPPGERYPTAEALLADLEARRDGRFVTAGTSYWSYRSRKFVRAHRAAIALAACASLALAALAAAGWWTSLNERRSLAAVRAAQEEARLSSSDAALLSASRAMDRGHFTEARDQLRLALDFNPDNAEAAYARDFLETTVPFARKLATFPLDFDALEIGLVDDGAFAIRHADGVVLCDPDGRLTPGASFSGAAETRHEIDGVRVEVETQGVVSFIDTATGAPAMAPLVVGSGRGLAAFHPRSRRVLAISPDRGATLWDASEMGRAYQSAKLDRPVNWLAFERGNATLWLTDRDSNMRAWREKEALPGFPRKMAALPADLGFTRSGEGHARGMPGASTGALVVVHTALWHWRSGGKVTCVAQAREADATMIGGDDPTGHTALAFQPEGRFLTKVEAHEGSADFVAIDAAATRGACINVDGLLQLVELPTAKVVHTRRLDRTAASMTLLDGARDLVVGFADGTASVFDAGTLEVRHAHLPLFGTVRPPSGIRLAAVPGKREFFARIDGDLELRRFSADTGLPCAPPLRHENGVGWFCSDGDFLFSVDQDDGSPGTLRVWSLRTHREIVPGLRHPAPLTWATVLDRGHRIATADTTGVVRRWAFMGEP
jgi:WD40 repeat protein/predicted Ser/Thr protein kinase